MIIVAGVVTCLGLAVAAVGDVDSESTVVFLLLVPTFFGGGCLLTLVNISWMSRRPGKRCSLVQLACNLVLILMTLYVEMLFWSYRRKIALAILCGAALPMWIFINMPSVFMLDEFYGEIDTVVMEDDEHSLFDVECSASSPQPGRGEENTGANATSTSQQASESRAQDAEVDTQQLAEDVDPDETDHEAGNSGDDTSHTTAEASEQLHTVLDARCDKAAGDGINEDDPDNFVVRKV